jgi:hypothetical protein
LSPAWQIVHKISSPKATGAKWTGDVAYPQIPEFKPQLHQKKKKKR